jgi:hypothetical protein
MQIKREDMVLKRNGCVFTLTKKRFLELNWSLLVNNIWKFPEK